MELENIRIYLCGQKYFGQEALKMLADMDKVEIVGVSAPPVGEDGKPDRLYKLCKLHGIQPMKAGNLNAGTLPENVDLIVCAHSHDFVGAKTLRDTKFGAIGYHPSLLPLHRGRDAVIWTIRMGDKVAGGSVYWLDNVVDGGPIAAQGWCFVHPKDKPMDLWKRDLQPMGIALLRKVIMDLQRGVIIKEPQNARLGSWEPSIGRPPLFRPDLEQIGPPPEGYDLTVKTNRWGGAEDKDQNQYALQEKFGFH